MSSRAKLSSRFSFANPRLIGARARLTEGQLVFTGWRLTGRFKRTIDLDRIVHVDVGSADGVVLWLVDGEVIRLRIKDPSVWKSAIDAPKAEAARIAAVLLLTTLSLAGVETQARSDLIFASDGGPDIGAPTRTRTPPHRALLWNPEIDNQTSYLP